MQFSRYEEVANIKEAQKPKLFEIQLMIKDVTANDPGRRRCFVCP